MFKQVCTPNQVLHAGKSEGCRPAFDVITEQVEEESTADEIVQQLKLMEGAPGGLFLMDRELAQRSTPKAPTPA